MKLLSLRHLAYAALLLAAFAGSGGCVNGAEVGFRCQSPNDCSSGNCSASGTDAGFCQCSAGQCGRASDCCGGGFCCQGGCTTVSCQVQTCDQAGNCSL